MNCHICDWPCVPREDRLCPSCRVRLAYERWQELKTPEALREYQEAKYMAMVD